MTRRISQSPIKEATLPKDHFKKLLEKARRNEEYWKRLSSISDAEMQDIEGNIE